MSRKKITGERKPMSEEARLKIAEAVRQAAARKRAEEGYLSPAVPDTEDDELELELEIELVRMKDQVFPEGLFDLMETGKAIDLAFTGDGGIPKACNYMMIGDPGVGKSTVSLDILSDLTTEGYKVLFISAEMTKIDLHGYVRRYPKFGDVETLFISDYMDVNPKKLIERVLNEGYDLVLIDSFAELQNHIKETLGVTAASAEKWITNLMLKHNSARNIQGTYTTFIAIQQVTKEGVQLGTNRLKHAMTGMIELRKDQKTGESYIEFTKNRRGTVNVKMYYSLHTTGDVRYDLERFAREVEFVGAPKT
jgi:predicted ATP-dependent serine protease